MKVQLLILLILVAQAAAINKIVTKGNKFFDSVTGQQFYIKGVAYQPAGDPIADIAGLQKDIPLLQAAGINLVRCYQTDWTLNHDQGMNLLAAAGIYLMVDLGDPKISISYRGPWSTAIFENYRRKVDAFINYPNTLGFLAGNEVILVPGSTINAAFIKAAVRDTKAYIKSKGFSTPVGYAGADVAASSNTIDYLNCHDPAESVDFYGLNVYSWCGNSNMQTANYNRFKQYSTYSVPFIFTEYGCNTVAPRTFTEVLSIYGPDLQDSLSGAIVYEWHQEANAYGLVSIGSNGDRTILPDYNTFKSQLAKVNPTQAQMSTYTATYPQQNCPAVTNPEVYDSDSNWMSAATPLPPTPNNPQCQCMFSQLTCRTTSEAFDYTTEPPTRFNDVQTVQNKVCVGTNCYPSGTAPQYGSYGTWSMCNMFEIISYDMNAYYTNNGGGCSYDQFQTNIVTPSNAGVDCTTIANDYNSYNVAAPGADPLTGGTTGSSTSSTGGSGSSSGTGGSGSGLCGAGLNQCGTACYKTSQYCCSGTTLYPAGQCPTAVSSATTATSGASSTTQTPATSVTSGASSTTQTPTPVSSTTTPDDASPAPSSTNSPVGSSDTPVPSASNNAEGTTTTAGIDTAARAQSSASTIYLGAAVATVCFLAAL